MTAPRRLARRVAPVEIQPDLPEEYKAVIVQSVRWAWSEVCEKWPEVVTSGREEEISTKLADVLNAQDVRGRRLAPGLSSFETVNRGAKVEGVDGGVEYQPDLVFRPFKMPGVRNRGSWGWFVECKVVRGAGSIRRYCDDGVQRFVDRRYAARMPSGAMLGYVRDDSEPYPSLEPRLSGRYGNAAVEPPDCQSRIKIRSRHDRTGAVSSKDRRIELTHLWLGALVPEASTLFETARAEVT